MVWKLIIIVAGLLGWFVQGWVLQSYWTWFVLPTFGVPVPSVLMCVGLSMTINLFTLKLDWDSIIFFSRMKKQQDIIYGLDDDSKEFLDVIKPFLAMFVYVICWVVGWIVHLMC